MIVSTPGTVGGQPRIDGTRLTTELIARLATRVDVEEIAWMYEITEAEVREAIEYERARS